MGVFGEHIDETLYNRDSFKRISAADYEALEKDYELLSKRVFELEKVVAFLVKENKINIVEMI